MIYMFFFVLNAIIFAAGLLCGLKYSSDETIHMKKSSDRYLNQLKLAVQWIKNPSKITNYIIKHNYKRVCIYGMSYFGDCLGEILTQNGINVVCGMDRDADRLYSFSIPIYNTNDDIPEVDVIIITAVVSYLDIKKDLIRKGKTNVISLEDILYE